MSFGATPERGPWHWTPQQDAHLYRRRRQGARLKQLAHEFGRSERTVSTRVAMLERLLEREAHEILEMHRQEEAELLEKLLKEQRLPDCGERP